MAWQYTEYADCPTLTDWVDRRFKFGITLDVVTTDIVERTEETPEGREITTLEFLTGSKLIPYMDMRVGENRNSILNLAFNKIYGLQRRMSTNQGVVEVGGVDYSAFKEQNIDTGSYEDFRTLGEYAVRRFPAISREIFLPPDNFLADIPEDELEEISKYAESCQSFPSWERVQKDLSNDFYEAFKLFMHFEVVKHNVQKRQHPFTQEQIQELERLVEPLRM